MGFIDNYFKEVEDKYGEIVTRMIFSKVILHTFLVMIVTSVIMGSFYIVGGTQYAVERTPGGEMQGVIEPGVHFKIPFISSVHKYDQVYTVAYQDDSDGNPATHGTLKRINFADTYGGYIGATIRFQILPDPVKLVKMHKAYLNDDNLMIAGLKPVAKQLLAYTANQITGENYMQGGQNEYQNRIEDQGNNGLYITKREKVLVARNTSTIGLDNQNPNTREQRNSYIYVNKIQKDKDGKILRNPLPISKYGIIVVQVTVDDFKPEDKLKDFINRKKDQIAIRQKLIENQENERQSAVTAELKGQRERVEAKQQMLKEKDAETIRAQKKVELEQKEADLQVVRKQKDLDVQLMEKKIQQAKSEAAIFQARAIEAKGMAEAKVKKAMYQAVRKDILQLEVTKVTEVARYEALKVAKIDMPNEVTIMGGGDGKGATLQEMTNFAIMGMKDSLKTVESNTKTK